MRLIGLAVVLGISLLIAPLAAEAQAGKVPRIGVIVPVEPESPNEPNIGAFRQALRDLGYIDGQNVAVDYRYARGRAELYLALAEDLVRLKVDVMVVGSWHPTSEAKKATQTIPIVGVGMGTDPVASGLVTSLARPGGNVTGLAWLTGLEFTGKYVELLKEVAPRTVRVIYLRDPRGLAQVPVTQRNSEAARAAARSLGLTFQMVEAPELPEVTNIFARILAHRRRLPVLHGSRRRHHEARCEVQATRDLLAESLHGCWGAHVIRSEPPGSVATGRQLRGQDPQGSEARGSAGGAAHHIRAGHQSQDREGPRADNSADAAAAGGPHHRVGVLDQRGQLLRAAVGFAGCSMPSYDRALWALGTWLDAWSGIGHVAAGMHRPGLICN